MALRPPAQQQFHGSAFVLIGALLLLVGVGGPLLFGRSGSRAGFSAEVLEVAAEVRPVRVSYVVRNATTEDAVAVCRFEGRAESGASVGKGRVTTPRPVPAGKSARFTTEVGFVAVPADATVECSKAVD